VSASKLAPRDLPGAIFLRAPQVLAMVPISNATLWRRVKSKTFPQPVKLGPKITAWRADEVEAWARSIQSKSVAAR
jgi:prophage regulatory protein